MVLSSGFSCWWDIIVFLVTCSFMSHNHANSPKHCTQSQTFLFELSLSHTFGIAFVCPSSLASFLPELLICALVHSRKRGSSPCFPLCLHSCLSPASLSPWRTPGVQNGISFAFMVPESISRGPKVGSQRCCSQSVSL